MILGKYAKQLTKAEGKKLASVTHGFSGRDLKAICEHAERCLASQVIPIPPFQPCTRGCSAALGFDGGSQRELAVSRKGYSQTCTHACTHSMHSIDRLGRGWRGRGRGREGRQN